MQELNDFFDLSKKPARRVEIKGPQTGGAMTINDDELEELFSKDRQAYAGTSKGTDYAERYKQLELEKSLQQLAVPEEEKAKEMLDDLTSLGDVNRVNDLLEDSLYYNKYKIQNRSRLQLPINNMKEKILSTIEQSPVTIIEGPTGCGKTTQIPHWILKDCYDKRQYCNIVVTQPRRIAAISVAKRVCEENSYEMSSIVGYQVGLDSKVSKDTRLSYVTTGVLLQKLVGSRNMDNLTHVILDEVHERDQDMDFLFIVVKKLRTANVKIVLMSATFDLDSFANYFRFSSYDGLQTPPILKIDSPRMYEIKIFYLNTLSILGKLPEIEYAEPGISKDMNIFTLKILNAFEFIDSNEEKNSDGTSANYMPSVLIFLPGIFEIEELYKILTNQRLRAEVSPDWCHCKWWIVPLHSTITSEEQQQVFKPTPPGHRKIILATNIAESSITVPDIKYVIDFCLTKVLMSNPETNFSTLRMTWASQANLKQRAGRAGRVREGRVYRMVLQDFYNKMDDNCIPEMQRCPLDNLVLKSKVLNMGPPVSILALAMDPPDLSNITRTILSLQQVGALLKTVSGEMSLDDGDITYLGRIMSKLPLDVRFSKLIMLGYIFGVLDDCIVMACGMSVKNIFSTPFNNRMAAYNSKLAWANGSTSDCLALLGVYNVYTHLRNINYFSSYQGGERAWAKSSFLQMNALRELVSLVTELKQRLARETIVSRNAQENLWNDIDRPFILKLLLAGAFYPFYFTLSRWGEDKEREATRTLCGRDPCTTVYFSGMDYFQPGIIYSERIKSLLTQCAPEDMTVAFDNNSSKVFVTFASRQSLKANKNKDKVSQIPGQVILPVYSAVKSRQIKVPTTIPVMTVEKSMEYAVKLGLYRSKGYKEWERVPLENKIQELMQPRLPDIDENYIHINISHVLDCSHFWCNYADQTTQDQLEWLRRCLQKPLPPLSAHPTLGQMCAAPLSTADGSSYFYHRARIDKINRDNLVWVFFIDIGINRLVPMNALKALDPQSDLLTKIKALAFKCVLTETAPSIVKDQRAIWTEAAYRRFVQLTKNKRLLGKVYSVAMGVVSLELISDNVSVNKTLVKEGFAQEVEESYNSRLNRDIRDTAENLQPIQKNALNQQQKKEYSSTVAMTIPPPDIKDCNREITLKGPFSPLETSLLNLMYAGKDKASHIEWSSVNSVLLTTDPQDLNDRLLVAACIDQSSSGGNLTLRHTTMLPNIRGLPSLVALIFSPRAELKPDATLCHYAAILCGLGHVDGSPLYPEQDILVPIDFELDRTDLQNINKLRYSMDLVLFTEEGQESPMNEPDVFATTRKIKSLFENLMTRNRRWREPSAVSRPWQWAANYDVDEAEATNFIGERAIYPPHNALELRTISPLELMKMAVENQKVHNACKGLLLCGPTTQRVECTLCHTDELTLTAMRLHLSSRLHKERESDLPRLDEEEDD